MFLTRFLYFHNYFSAFDFHNYFTEHLMSIELIIKKVSKNVSKEDFDFKKNTKDTQHIKAKY